MAAIHDFRDVGRCRRGVETGPPGAGIVFRAGIEKHLAASDTKVAARFFIVPIIVAKRRFGAALTRYAVLFGGKFLAKFIIGRHERV